MDIRIGTFNYNVEEIKEPIIYDFNQVNGMSNYRDLTIKLDSKLNQQKK